MSNSTDKPEVEDDVFEHITAPVECVQDYGLGGLHPVHLGDKVHGERYKILRKLGYGGYSTVWLAQDNGSNGSFVALKVVRADSDCAKETRCYDALWANAGQHPGSSCVMMLEDHFSIEGPNGSHDCLAYEVLGPSVARVREESADFDTTAYLTLPCARRIVHQVLLGLDYMHSISMIHGDLYAANVLFAVRDFSQEPVDILCPPYDQVSVDVRRIRGPRQPGDPRHLTLDRPLNQFVSPNGNVKLADLGSCFFENDPPVKQETPLECRIPEMIFDDHFSMAQDSWAFGCLIYNVLTNYYPFNLAFIYGKESRHDAHILQLFSLLGPLPARLKNRWPRYGLYFDDEGQLKKFDVDDNAFSYLELEDSSEEDLSSTASETLNNSIEQKANETGSIALPDHQRIPQDRFDSEHYPSIIKICDRKIHEDQADPESLAEFTALNPPLRQRWLDVKHPDMELDESELVLDLLHGLFTYDPNRRLSTKEILQHPWIQNYCAPANESNKVSERSAIVQGHKRKRSNTNEK